LQGITLLSVIAVGFAAGVGKGQIDSRLDDVLRVREEQRMQLTQLSQQVAELGKSISYLQGYLQNSAADGNHAPTPKARS
jgi:TolA-binding protein